MMRPVLLFGANGFIGRHVARALVERGCDTLSVGRRDSLTAGVRHFPWGWDDPQSAALVASLRPRAILSFLAASPGAAADLHQDITLDSQCRLADLAATIGDCRFVTFGSAAEYGLAGEGAPLAEDAPRRPISAYGQAKAALMDHIAARHAMGQDIIGLRLFSVIGAGMAEHSLVGRALRQIADPAAQELVLGPLDGARDIAPVTDLAQCIAEVALWPGRIAAWLNMGTGSATGLMPLVQALIVASGRALGLRQAPLARGTTTGGRIVADPRRMNAMGLVLAALPVEKLAAIALDGGATAKGRP